MANRKWNMGLVEGGISIDLNEYNPELNKNLKASLPGPVKWDGYNKWWIFPQHWDTCLNARKVADQYGAKIRIAPALAEWAKQEKERQAEIPDVQSMELADLGIVRQSYPHIWDALSSRPFQTVGAAFAARNRSCLIADQPGLGKTIQSIAAIIESGVTGPILVVAPKAAAKLTWPQELARWVPDDEVVIIGSHLKPDERGYAIDLAMETAEEKPQRIWILTSPNYLRVRAKVDQYGKYERDSKGQKIIATSQEGLLEFFDYKWAGVIVDESHQTLAGASGDKKKQSAQRVGLGALDVKDGGLRIALSGTPFRGKEEYLWGQLNFLRPDLYRSRWRWMEQFFQVSRGRYGMEIGGLMDRAGMYKDCSRVMIRRTKGEVAKDLPAKQYGGWPLWPAEYMPCDEPGCMEEHNHEYHEHIVKEQGPVAIWLEMDPKQAKAYDEIRKRAEAELEGGTLMINGVLAELTRLKQFAGSYGRMDLDHFTPTLPSNKFDWLVEFLDERGISKDMDKEAPKIVVTSQFSQLINAFAAGLEELGIHCYKFTGETSDTKREEIKNDFQNNPTSKVRVLLLTTTAGGVSLTLDAADELVMLDETWVASDQEQVEDRLHRLSRIHQVTIWKVFSKDTIEEGIARTNFERDRSIKSIIDGERGITMELGRQLIHGT